MLTVVRNTLYLNSYLVNVALAVMVPSDKVLCITEDIFYLLGFFVLIVCQKLVEVGASSVVWFLHSI